MNEVVVIKKKDNSEVPFGTIILINGVPYVLSKITKPAYTGAFLCSLKNGSTVKVDYDSLSVNSSEIACAIGSSFPMYEFDILNSVKITIEETHE